MNKIIVKFCDCPVCKRDLELRESAVEANAGHKSKHQRGEALLNAVQFSVQAARVILAIAILVFIECIVIWAIY